MRLDDEHTDPYARTVYFKICSRRGSEHPNQQYPSCLKRQPGQTCISNVACAKPKVPLLDSDGIFGRLNSRIVPWAKVVDFVPLDALSGPGAQDPDLAQCNVTSKH